MTEMGDRPKINRRSAIGLTTLAIAGLPLHAAAEAAAAIAPESYPLWPSVPPGGLGLDLSLRTVNVSRRPGIFDRRLSSIAKPELKIYRPAKPDGSALLIIPGGGYSFEAIDMEGNEPALRFVANGATAFVLTYRLPYEGWKDGPDVPLQDAQRAMRIIRAMGPKEFGIDPDKIGVLGFSAGGHLAATLAARYSVQTYAALDEIDAEDARPNFAGLLYPVITMLPPFGHESSCEKLLGADAPLELRKAYSAELLVNEKTAPCFLAAAADDPDVPVDNTLMMLASLRANKIPAETHIFEEGGHGFGLRAPSSLPVSDWPDLFWQWGASRGYFRAAPS